VPVASLDFGLSYSIMKFIFQADLNLKESGFLCQMSSFFYQDTRHTQFSITFLVNPFGALIKIGPSVLLKTLEMKYLLYTIKYGEGHGL
jgi:hypothetical protein